LDELVAYPTVSDRPVDAIAGALAQRAEDAGGRVSCLESSPGKVNVVARFGPQGTDGIILSGHMDVVPTVGQEWTTDPFKMTELDGKLLGRGTADMKGFLAAATTALQRIPIKRLERELVFIWTHDEEIGCLGSRILAEQWRDTLGDLPQFAWIGEPTSFQVCRMHPGHTTLEIQCTGRAAHSSRPGLGTNAIHIARLTLEVLDQLAESWMKEQRFTEHLQSPFTAMNIGTINGGSAVNIVPDRCTIRLGIRPLPGEAEDLRVNEIRAALGPAQQQARVLQGAIHLQVIQVAPALLTPAGTPLEALLCPHASSPVPTAAPFATDGGNLAALDISSLVFGPGSIDVAHRADEYIPAHDLIECVDVIASVVRSRCLPTESGA
jgi:acetylornithine deacetylase